MPLFILHPSTFLPRRRRRFIPGGESRYIYAIQRGYRRRTASRHQPRPPNHVEPTQRNRVIALAALFQAASLVKDVAWHGRCDPDDFRTMVGSLFSFEAADIDGIYGNVHRLRRGMQAMADQRDRLHARRACCCRTSPACRRWSTWPPCATRWKRLGGDPRRSTRCSPAELVIDHSVQVDEFGTPRASRQREIELRAQPRALRVPALGPAGLRQLPVVPPDTGIVHQVNLEYLARVVFERRTGRLQAPTRTRWSAPTPTPP
jgi:hypothetical protein